MGSGSSKGKTTTKNPDPKSPAKGPSKDTNSNNTPKHKESAKKDTPVKNNSMKNGENTPKKAKVSNNNHWDSDSDLEKDLDAFIKETVTSSATAVTSNNDEGSARPRTSHGRSARAQQNMYPETYAQKHTRENYTVDREMLIRQKTIYRNPNDWDSDGDDEEMSNNNHGFDASKFRQVNQQKKPPDPHADPVSSTAQEFETPRYLKSQDENYGIYQKDLQKEAINRKISRLPSYDMDEQRFLAELENEL
ncbi:hypothetical protein SNE40_021529 [Patella caerulea]|uniref:Uncharacterized protein n=1 Tax=Patella caerulea TaxID=87958 RepID=A0AAN8GBC5_PATCE